MKFPQPRSFTLRQRLTGILCILAVGLLVVLGSYHLRSVEKSARGELASVGGAVLQSLTPLLAQALDEEGDEAKKELTMVLQNLTEVHSLNLYREDNKVAYSYIQNESDRSLSHTSIDQEEMTWDEFYMGRPLVKDKETIGSVSIALSSLSYRGQLVSAFLSYLALSLGLLAFFGIIILWLDYSLAAPILKTTRFVKTFFEDKNNLSQRIEVKRGAREVQQLQAGINGLLDEMSSHDVLMRNSLHQAQISEQITAERSQFVATMSHELRTPLNAVIGFSQLLDMEKLEPEQREYIRHIQSAGEHLLSLVNDTLDLSKLESGNIEFERKPYHMGRLVVKAVHMFSNQSREKGVPIFSAIANDTADLMIGDPSRIQQVLINLVGNAVKFTKEGSITISVYQSGSPDAPSLTVAVKDTGAGIPLHRQAAIFERYQQANESTTRNFGGTGLGLSIVRELIEQMGGSVHLDSEEGKGSTFAFSLPLPVQEELAGVQTEGFEETVPESEPAQEAALHAAKMIRKKRVLLVDDVTANQIVGRRLLEVVGCEVAIASDGQEAIEKVGQEHFDLVLMDFHMPGVDGLQATQVIRTTRSMQDLPIWALTADTTPEAKEQCVAAGMNGVITKPFQLEDLQLALDSTVNSEMRLSYG